MITVLKDTITDKKEKENEIIVLSDEEQRLRRKDPLLMPNI